MNEQLCFDFYNEPLPGASDRQASGSQSAPQETLATYRGKVYHLVFNYDSPRSCKGCVNENVEDNDFCRATEWLCGEHDHLVWREKP